MTDWTVAIGVDTHKGAHVAVALDRLGAQIDSLTVNATLAGYRRLLAWATDLGRPVFGVEGCGSYGAGLVRFLEAERVLVYECERPRRNERRRGKNDLIDAALAARRVVPGEGLSLPRRWSARAVAALAGRAARGCAGAHGGPQQLGALVVTAPDPLRHRLAALSKHQLARKAALLRSGSGPAADVLRRIARRVERLSWEITEIDRDLSILVTEIAPHPLDECGVGAVYAAQLLVSSGDPGRMASEASFAALAGTTPVNASSRKQQRHRLNRGGNRQLNWALHVIALQPIHHTPRHGRLLPAPPQRRQDHPGSTPLRQTHPRPPLLPAASNNTNTNLDNIEASGFRPVPSGLHRQADVAHRSVGSTPAPLR